MIDEFKKIHNNNLNTQNKSNESALSINLLNNNSQTKLKKYAVSKNKILVVDKFNKANDVNQVDIIDQTNVINQVNVINQITVTTKLWNHQEKVRSQIITAINKFNQRGFGDASDVGSGKTLTALSIPSHRANSVYSKLILNYIFFHFI